MFFRHKKNMSLSARIILIISIRLRHSMRHIKTFIKWILLSILIGAVTGVVGSAFNYALNNAAEMAVTNDILLYFLPIAGIIIVFMYRGFDLKNDQGTNSILQAARAENTSALRVAPLVFTATFLTHLCSGSAGREGAALQIGGSIGSFTGRKLNLGKYDQQVMVMCGMSACFCSLFGTPLTAAFFAIEVAGFKGGFK